MRDASRERRNQILGAATRLVGARGAQALSFEAVAKEADLSRQLVRYYFPDLDALIVALCDHLGNGYRELLVAGIVEVDRVARLDFFLDFFFDLAEGHEMPSDLAVYDSLLAWAVGSDALRERLCGQYRTLGQVVSHELDIARPELGGQACEELSYLFVSMMHAHWSFVASLGHAGDHGRLMRRAMDRLIESYAQDPPGARAMERPWSMEG